MTLGFPVALADLADLLPIETAPFSPKWQQETTGLGAGELLRHDLGPRLWVVDVATIPVKHIEVRGLKSRIEAAAEGAFYLYDPVNCFPTHDPGGALLGSSTVTVLSVNADNIRIALQGLPAGYVLEDDLIAIDYGSPTRRALVRMIGSVTAGGDGKTAQFEVRPQLRPGIATADAVTLIKPAAKMTIVPGSLTYEPVGTTMQRVHFSAQQTLQAG